MRPTSQRSRPTGEATAWSGHLSRPRPCCSGPRTRSCNSAGRCVCSPRRELDVRESARLLGFVHVATADAMITCFESKYYFSFWRPFHAIRRADTDENRATTPDPTWTSFLVVNHPSTPPAIPA